MTYTINARGLWAEFQSLTEGENYKPAHVTVFIINLVVQIIRQYINNSYKGPGAKEDEDENLMNLETEAEVAAFVKNNANSSKK